jgi:predicted ribosome quality control (RQC) complex YloA/Tae2 family protein
MENLFLAAIVEEIRPAVCGRTVSKILSTGYDLLIDLRLADEKYLKISVDPVSPGMYLSGKKPVSSADSKSSPYFPAILRKNLVGSRLLDLRKEALDRRLQLDFEGFDSAGERRRASLFINLTGSTSNLFLTDESGCVESIWLQRGGFQPGDVLKLNEKTFDPGSLVEHLSDSMSAEEIDDRFFKSNPLFGPMIKKEFLARASHQSAAQAFRSLIADLFIKDAVPLLYTRIPTDLVGKRPVRIKDDLLLSRFEISTADGFERVEFSSMSEAAEAYYDLRAKAIEFQKELSHLKQFLKAEIKKRENLLRAVAADRAGHEVPERLKRYGDLLLANLATAVLNEGKVKLVDYFDPRLPEIEIGIERGLSLQQAAAGFFARYQKARRALSAIENREEELRAGLEPLKKMWLDLERDPTLERIEEINSLLDRSQSRRPGPTATRQPVKQTGQKSKRSVGRWFLSTDGFEIIVGRNDRDNDQVTFRLARPQDIWMHAADYPGSHVVIRNPQRAEVPYRAIVEAAEIAAFYSSAKDQGKAAVHYTQKKFVSKPPRSKPGLVRLSSFKTVMVEPRCGVERISG